jgi:hypothetical protein
MAGYFFSSISLSRFLINELHAFSHAFSVKGYLIDLKDIFTLKAKADH